MATGVGGTVHRWWLRRPYLADDLIKDLEGGRGM